MIEAVSNENLEEVLPLIIDYQAFYGVKNIDEKKNRLFFSQFVNGNADGVLYLYRLDGEVAGFFTIYKSFSSTRAEAVAVLNDLYVQPSCRGKGIGKALIEHAQKVAKNSGYSRLQWLTAQDNEEAQRLYNSVGANKSEWFFYAKDI